MNNTKIQPDRLVIKVSISERLIVGISRFDNRSPWPITNKRGLLSRYIVTSMSAPTFNSQ